MGPLRPIPRTALPDTMVVRVPDGDGGFREPRAICGVRYERRQRACDDGHRTADAGSGTVFVDAVNSWGAFEVPAGSRVSVRGRSYYVAECFAAEDLFGRVHHWELKVR
jgi:hypothetical protein